MLNAGTVKPRKNHLLLFGQSYRDPSSSCLECNSSWKVMTSHLNVFMVASLIPQQELSAGFSCVQRSGDARGDCLIGCPPFYILVLSSGIWWSFYWIYDVCDVTI